MRDLIQNVNICILILVLSRRIFETSFVFDCEGLSNKIPMYSL